jgi:hypothetical protein
MPVTAPSTVPVATTAKLCARAVLQIGISFVLVARGGARAALSPFER